MEEANKICSNSRTTLLNLYSSAFNFSSFPLSEPRQLDLLIQYFNQEIDNFSEYLLQIHPYLTFFIFGIIFLLLWIGISILWIWKRTIKFPRLKFFFQLIIHIPILLVGIAIIICSSININRIR